MKMSLLQKDAKMQQIISISEESAIIKALKKQ